MPFTDAAQQALTLADRLQRSQRISALRGSAMLPFAGAALLVIVAGAVMGADAIAAVLRRCIDQPLLAIVAIAWPVAAWAARRRRNARADASRSWLAALPITATQFERNTRRRTSLQLAVIIATASLPLAIVVRTGSLAPGEAGTCVLLLLSGLAAGVGAGWLRGGRDRPLRRVRLTATTDPHRRQHHVLTRWPLHHALAHADIGLHVRAIAALLLTFPVGTPPFVALALLAIVTLALLAWELARALLHSTARAGAWLRSLPLRPLRAASTLASASMTIITIALVALASLLASSPLGAQRAWLIGMTAIAALLIACVVTCRLHQPFEARR